MCMIELNHYNILCTPTLQSLKLVALAVSLGGAESLVCHPASTTHHDACVSPEVRKLAGITDNLIRLRYVYAT